MALATSDGGGSNAHVTRLFNDVVLPHLDDAFTFAFWLSGDRAAAEDVVHDAYLRAYASVCSLRGHARVWVMTIVRTTAYERQRTNRHPTPASLCDLHTPELAASAAGGTCGDDAAPVLIPPPDADWKQLQLAMARLEPDLREAFVLRELLGFDYGEIASITGVTSAAVTARLAEARYRLTRVSR